MAELTNDRDDPRLGHGPDDEPGPQNEVYLVLSEEDRARGFTRPLRFTYKHLKCGSVTSMSQSIAETYARQPNFYGSTYCCSCRMHLDVAGFVWDGTDIQVGS